MTRAVSPEQFVRDIIAHVLIENPGESPMALAIAVLRDIRPHIVINDEYRIVHIRREPPSFDILEAPTVVTDPGAVWIELAPPMKITAFSGVQVKVIT